MKDLMSYGSVKLKKISFVGEGNIRCLNWRINDSPYQKNRVFLQKAAGDDRLVGYLSYAEGKRGKSLPSLGFDVYFNKLR